MSQSVLLPEKYTFHLEPRNRDYKTRNILTVEDRVAVIRDYEKNPVYQRLAEKYNCSSKQIKNIIANKDAVLLYHDNRMADGSTSDERRQRQQKIVFLGKVIYEFIQRAVYHGVQLDTSIVRRKALDVKESIAIMNFSPNNAWMQNFKSQYNVPEFDLMTLRQVMFLDEAKEESFKAVDLIQFVSKREKEQEQKQQQQQRQEELKSLPPPLMRISIHGDDQQDQKLDIAEPTIAYECLSDDYDTYMDSNDANNMNGTSMVLTLDSDDDNDILVTVTKDHGSAATDIKVPLTPLPDVTSCQEALRHLQVLEDYAMLSENFRAIGLIAQLQQVLKDPPRSDEFFLD